MSNARAQTRDLLLEYDHNIIPPRPRAAGLAMVYPWENMPLTIFSKLLYSVAVKHGFTGSEQAFFEKFITFSSDKEIYFGELVTFPETGADNMLYFDTTESILYYWDNQYIPVNALLIPDTILDAGTSTD